MTSLDFYGDICAHEILSPDKYLILTKSGELVSDKGSCQIAEKFRFPILKRIDDDLVLIVRCRCEEHTKNAKVYNFDGKLQYEFEAGDAVNDVIVCDRKLVFSYFDEGVLSQKKISKDGLVVFNKKGKVIWGFNSNSDYEIWDCYQIIKTGENRVFFFGYGKFPTLELDINFYKLTEVENLIDPYVDSVSFLDNTFFWIKSKQIWAWNRDSQEKKVLRNLEKKDGKILVKNNIVYLSKKGFNFTKLR